MGKLRRGFDDVESVVLFLGSSSSVQPPDIEEQKEDEIKDEISPSVKSLPIERMGKRLEENESSFNILILLFRPVMPGGSFDYSSNSRLNYLRDPRLNKGLSLSI